VGRLLRRAHIRVEAPMRMFREVDSAGRLLRSLLSAPADQAKKIGVYLKPQASKGTPIGVYLKPQQGTIHQKTNQPRILTPGEHRNTLGEETQRAGTLTSRR
jgi:hypothetical protein